MTFIPKIFDASTDGELPSSEFNAATILLDGTLSSDLKWDAQKKRADELIEKGYKILWEIDLGLFSRLTFPLKDEAQGNILKLSLEVFYQQIWEKYKEESLGLLLYRGSSDFTHEFPDEKEKNLHCCQVCIDYLDYITQDMPDSLPLFLAIDASGATNSGFLAQVLSRERFENYQLIIHGGPLPLQGLAWNDDRATVGYLSKKPISLKTKEMANVALCLPPLSEEFDSLTGVIDEMNQLGLHYRIIPELFLTVEWDGLDYLLFNPLSLSSLGERKLQGFCAAGGTVVTLGDKIGLPYELSYKELLEIL